MDFPALLQPFPLPFLVATIPPSLPKNTFQAAKLSFFLRKQQIETALAALKPQVSAAKLGVPSPAGLDGLRLQAVPGEG